MSERVLSIEQNLIDAGCSKEFIERFMRLTEKQQTADILKTGAAAIRRFSFYFPPRRSIFSGAAPSV